MRVLRRGRVSVLIAVAIGLAAAGIAYAAIPDSDGVIHGCYQRNNGQLRVIDSAGKCSSSETSLNWSQRGVKGPTGTTGATGPSGPKGPSGPGGTLAWARVNSDGTIRVGSNVHYVDHQRTGTYCVVLNEDIDVHSVAAVVSSVGGRGHHVAVTAAPGGCGTSLNDLGIDVGIWTTSTDIDVDDAFMIVIP